MWSLYSTFNYRVYWLSKSSIVQIRGNTGADILPDAKQGRVQGRHPGKWGSPTYNHYQRGKKRQSTKRASCHIWRFGEVRYRWGGGKSLFIRKKKKHIKAPRWREHGIPENLQLVQTGKCKRRKGQESTARCKAGTSSWRLRFEKVYILFQKQ